MLKKNKRFKLTLKLFGLAILLIISMGCQDTQNAKETKTSSSQPNIIVIYTDDQGYADLSIQGQVQDISTPNIDALASNGARFTSGYVTAPVCGPSRVGLLTGMYQQRFGIEQNADLKDPHKFLLNIQTFPQRMQDSGYKTGLVGKLHTGRNITTMGFDEYFLRPNIWHDKYNSTHSLEGKPYANPRRIDLSDEDGYRINWESKAAVQFIKRNSKDKGTPFFLYLAYSSPHVPLEASQKYLDKFSFIDDRERRFCLAMMAMIDDGVGDVMSSLKDLGLEENTLIYFISDNGAPLTPNQPGFNGSLNAPLSGEKGLPMEGGVRVPWIVQWKGEIPAGQVINTPVITLDVAATSLVAAGESVPKKLDGFNLLPLLKNEKKLPKRKLFWYSRAMRAVRDGKWKLFQTTHREFNYLVNLEEDISAKNNIAKFHPDIVKRLDIALTEWHSNTKTSPATEMHPFFKKLIHKYYPEF